MTRTPAAGVALFLAVSHEAMHLGQLAAWRRALGLPSALGRMGRARAPGRDLSR